MSMPRTPYGRNRSCRLGHNVAYYHCIQPRVIFLSQQMLACLTAGRVGCSPPTTMYVLAAHWHDNRWHPKGIVGYLEDISCASSRVPGLAVLELK